MRGLILLDDNDIGNKGGSMTEENMRTTQQKNHVRDRHHSYISNQMNGCMMQVKRTINIFNAREQSW
jgi:hypothetical protein